MSEFTKIYLPILGAILLFSGFWYIKTYFGFYDMREVVAELSIDYIGQMSFVVFYNLIFFTNMSSSLLFMAIVVLPFILARAFPVTDVVRVENKPSNKLISLLRTGVSFFRQLSLPIKLILVAWVLSFAIWRVSSDLGTTHACNLMQTRTDQISESFNESISSNNAWNELLDKLAISGDVILDSGNKPILFEIWRNGDWAYFGTRAKNCTGQHFTIKITTSQIPLSVSSISSE